ncbi:putative baseplate assembly protein [Burkholderiales bacterium 8X]|nr:putative baseplate assembly protein [Burkholderiales bacterium 8X]
MKPHLLSRPPESDSCGCCSGIGAETPQGIDNRYGLSAVRYRIGDQAGFASSLRHALSRSRFAPLGQLRTRDADDFTIALIDAFACSADVLTFYQERIANESFLRTATERVSLQELGKLVGYRLRPGVAAESWLAFALETPPTAPAGLAPEPGNFVTGVPTRVSLSAGLAVQSVPGPGEKPQAFETVEALLEARPEWSAIQPWMSESGRPARGDTRTYLAGVGNGLKPGDALLIVGSEFDANPDSNAWDFRLIERVELQPAFDRTLVAWKRGLGSISPSMSPSATPRVHVLRRRASAFGHNAPMWQAMGSDFRRSYPGGTDATDWPEFVLSRHAASSVIDLDAVYPEIANGSLLVLAKGSFDYASEPAPGGTYVELYRVAGVSEVSRAEFALSAKLTRLRLSGANYDTQFRRQVRETAVFAQSQQLELAPYPVAGEVEGDRIEVAVDAEGLLPGRRLVVRGTAAKDGSPVVAAVSLVEAVPAGRGCCVLRIAPPLAVPLRRASVVVHANVTLASHGQSVSQVLGSGDASRAFQRFELKHAPLSWRAAANELGAEADIELRIGDIAWTRRRSLFEAGAGERSYALETDEQGRNFALFGDGIRGARLPTRPNNVRATYRKGLGSEGNVAAGKLTQLMSRPIGLKSVSNPLAAAGGTDPEGADAARQSIPLVTRTLGRAVSLLDYEDFARAFSGIAKASAAVLQLPAGATVAITLAAPGGEPISPESPVWVHLIAALQKSGDPYVPVRLLASRHSHFRLGLRIEVEPGWQASTVLAAVEAALRDRFGFDRRQLGQPVQQSEVIATAQAVSGVRAVDLTRLHGGSQPVSQTLPSVQVRLLASRMRVANGMALPAELLTLDPGPLDTLEEMT